MKTHIKRPEGEVKRIAVETKQEGTQIDDFLADLTEILEDLNASVCEGHKDFATSMGCQEKDRDEVQNTLCGGINGFFNLFGCSAVAPCEDDDDCEDDEKCKKGVCLAECDDDDDCPSGSVCYEELCREIECDVDSQCDDDEICDDHICVSE